MEQYNIRTSKGEFVVEDIVNSIYEAYQDGYVFYKLICKLSEATEEDASKVVDFHLKGGWLKCYYNYERRYYSNSLYTALDSLHSLLKSNNITGDNLYIFKKI